MSLSFKIICTNLLKGRYQDWGCYYGFLRLGGRMLIAFLACISGVSNTCIHTWAIYGCIGYCCILVTLWWAKCKTKSLCFLNAFGITKHWSNKVMLLWADNWSWTVQNSCNNESKFFLDLEKPEAMVLDSDWYCWSDWQALIMSSSMLVMGCTSSRYMIQQFTIQQVMIQWCIIYA